MLIYNNGDLAMSRHQHGSSFSVEPITPHPQRQSLASQASGRLIPLFSTST